MADTVRISLVFPRSLWEECKQTIPAGDRSRVIAEATEREIRRLGRLASVERLRHLQADLRQKYGTLADGADDIRAMREERDDQIAGMH